MRRRDRLRALEALGPFVTQDLSVRDAVLMLGDPGYQQPWGETAPPIGYNAAMRYRRLGSSDLVVCRNYHAAFFALVVKALTRAKYRVHSDLRGAVPELARASDRNSAGRPRPAMPTAPILRSARRDRECRVVVYLKLTGESEAAHGREYVRG